MGESLLVFVMFSVDFVEFASWDVANVDYTKNECFPTLLDEYVL